MLIQKRENGGGRDLIRVGAEGELLGPSDHPLLGFTPLFLRNMAARDSPMKLLGMSCVEDYRVSEACKGAAVSLVGKAFHPESAGAGISTLPLQCAVAAADTSLPLVYHGVELNVVK